jgi:magnesium transporter
MTQAVSEHVKRVTYRPQERVALLRSLSVAEQSAVMQHVSPYVQQQILRELSDKEIIDILDHLDLQTAHHIVSRIKNESRRQNIVGALKADIKDKVEYFLRFHPKASFSLIHFNYIFVPQTTLIGEASTIIEQHYEETGKFPEILVHDNGTLVGEVSFGVLVRERNTNALSKYVQPVATITYQAEVSDILLVLTEHEKKKVVVLDNDGSVLGLIYADDALELIGHLPAESLYSFAGVASSERPFDSAFTKFKSRSPWLVLNLATAFLAASVILLFQDTMNALTFLSVYIPIVAGMGGNSASQTFAVIMRGITLGSISWADGWPAVRREVLAGLMSGVLIGGIVSTISLVLGQSVWLGLVIAISMVGVHVVAGFFGSIIPLLIKRLGLDPANKSMIFISTTTDVAGLLLLLGIGTWLLL